MSFFKLNLELLIDLLISEWAILIPSWSIVVVILTYIVYFAIAIRATPSFDEMSAISGNSPSTSIPKLLD